MLEPEVTEMVSNVPGQKYVKTHSLTQPAELQFRDNQEAQVLTETW